MLAPLSRVRDAKTLEHSRDTGDDHDHADESGKEHGRVHEPRAQALALQQHLAKKA